MTKTKAKAHYQVQVEETDNTLRDCGDALSQKRLAVKIARHLAKNCPHGAANYLVFNNRTELFCFVAKVEG